MAIDQCSDVFGDGMKQNCHLLTSHYDKPEVDFVIDIFIRNRIYVIRQAFREYKRERERE